MAKGKKARKGDDSDEGKSEEELTQQPAEDKKKKGGKKGASSKASDEVEEVRNNMDRLDINEEEERGGKKAGKKDKKGKKKVVDSDEEEEEEEEEVVRAPPPKKENKKKSKQKADSDEDEPVRGKKIGGFALLMDDNDSLPSEEEKSDREEEEKVVVKEAPKKEKKKKKKADIEPMEEEEQEMEAEENKEEKGGKKKKKKKGKKEDDEDLDAMLAALRAEYNDEAPPPEAEAAFEDKEAAAAAGGKKKKKGKKEKEAPPEEAVEAGFEVIDAEEAAGGGEEGAQGLKTAAQKRKEKKERQKQKEDKKPTTTSTPVTAAAEATPAAVVKDVEEEKETGEPGGEDEAEGEGGKKGKKKKGAAAAKKEKEEEEKKKKKPGKAVLAAMQEALARQREEEERLRKEEEEKERAEEERIRLALEKKRLDEEKRLAKKEREKQKKAELKAQGKLLTPAQKIAKQRAEAMLEAMRAQGVDVPVVGEKRPRPGTRVRGNKGKGKQEQKEEEEAGDKAEQQQQQQQQHEEEEEEQQQPAEEPAAAAEEAKDEPVDSWEEALEVKDSWEIEDSEKEEKKPPAAESKPKAAAAEAAKKAGAAVTGKKPAAEESEEEESDEEDEESSEEEDSEEESEEEESDEESEEEDIAEAEKKKRRAVERIEKRKEENARKRTTDVLRAPVVCVLGHVDTGKTKILDKLRRTNVQDGEAGGITQQIGATNVPIAVIQEQCKMVPEFERSPLKLPGLLIIDTPGHESFSNLRDRGSSLCDIAILVIDIMHSLEPQTIESLNLLKKKKTPFVVALNKVDRLYEWKPNRHKDIREVLEMQQHNTRMEFQKRKDEVILGLNEQGLNAALFWENPDPTDYVSLVPTSAHSGDGMGNLMAALVQLSQTQLAQRLSYTEELQATVLEVKAIGGFGTTIDVVLVNGRLKFGQTIILAGTEGPIVTTIKALLTPAKMQDLRVKNQYIEHKELQAAQGVKIAAKELEKAIAGLSLRVAYFPDEVEILKAEAEHDLKSALNAIKLKDRGVFVQASTLGSLEALLEFLKSSKIPYAGVRIGPVVRKDVMRASTMLEHEEKYAVILAFDVKVEKDAQEMADREGVRIFQADIIYHLFDRFTEYQADLVRQKKDQFRSVAVFPCKLKIMKEHIYMSRDPIVVGVRVEAGIVKTGTPICVPSKDFIYIGICTGIQHNNKDVEFARKGDEVCVKIEAVPGEAPKMFGRHFDDTDLLISRISRESIDACKDYFRDELQKTDWALMIELKKLFEIL